MNVKEAAERAGVSVRTLHYYEEAGLIHPSRNPENGYRLYLEADVRRARLARALRELHIPLKEVAKLLDASPAERDARLEVHRNRLIEQRQKLNNRIALLDGLRMLGVSRAESLDCATLDDEMARARAFLQHDAFVQTLSQRLASLTSEEGNAFTAELLHRFAALAHSESASSVDALRQCIETYLSPCSDQSLLAFGRMLGGDGIFGQQVDADFGAGTARRAIKALERALRRDSE